VIRNDGDLRTAQENLRRLERFLLAARASHDPEDYPRMAEPFLLEIQERQREILMYLSVARPREVAA
jgi:hypothetical protein